MKRLFFVFISLLFLYSCTLEVEPEDAVSNSGVGKINVEVNTNADGKTIEQLNYSERIRRDNLIGSIKHLYVISDLSGQVLLYSTVVGKVTSSSKRPVPSTVIGDVYNYNKVLIGGETYLTNEVLGEDGMYGPSVAYIYWFDTRGVYHQHYKGENQMLHISDQPLTVKNIVLNFETQIK